MTAGQIEFLLPIPEKWEAKSRFTLFFDIGNVFSVGDVEFYDKAHQPIDYDFDLGELKRSYGIAAQWLAPLGLFRFSYAFPLDADDRPPTFCTVTVPSVSSFRSVAHSRLRHKSIWQRQPLIITQL